MSYRGELYIAHDDEAQLDVIEQFMESEHLSLLIIDPHSAIEYIKELRSDYNCYVVFLCANADPSKESRRIIYINNEFDLMSQNFLRRYGGLVAFF